MTDQYPLVSIITVTYQAVETIEQSILSVIRQGKLVDYIIIDGGSTDGTVDVIEKFQNYITYWVSEPDGGIYDAMNKGITQATGRWIYFLGSDDVLSENILESIWNTLLTDEASLIYGNVQYDYGKYFRSSFGLKTLLHNTVHHQAAFYRRSLFNNFSYDRSLKVIADYELNLIIYQRSIPHLYIDKVIAICSGGGRSYNIALSKWETDQVRSKHIKGLTQLIYKKILSIKYFISYVLLRKI